MTSKLALVGILAVSLCLFVVSLTHASTALWPVEYHTVNGRLLALHTEGKTTLNNAPDYDWWYGCSPTSAGMMMGYYDRNGYGGLYYDNLVPGGQAELSTFGPGPYIANDAIASKGHTDHFYPGDMVTAYGNSGDDIPGRTSAQFDSLADFMGTSQDSVGNSNGSTSFWNCVDGSRLYASNIFGYGPYYYNTSGMFGMWEYVEYTGYGSEDPDSNFFNQYIKGYGNNPNMGFTFTDYMAEIDAGRVVMIHVEGHSMFGYGYDALTNEIILHDTSSPAEHSMTWGGSYYDMELYGVTCFIPTGGEVPIPGALWLLGSGLIGLVAVRKRRVE